ncbi:alpha-keto acid decarboxylase family protein [Paenibacillus chibensis]|uniref:alpha-keto acid decarboxylase family protein n=1 Tax=Paenibacillus chibensis TaxID=59846 RepID=UPI000FD87AD3|nr:thiamine pyrophosphate-binding protein [Paenibacillus chibensis]MEC0370237.1 thiamine pyrophosphate-binding protein [Paenibacillus chibensis]
MENMTNELSQMPLIQKTLGEYLFDRLKQEGITDIFGVPGDYNFTLLDALERYEGIRFVNGRNELNSGYAADAYARLKGMSALITTFGVGEMSACNAIAGANSEHVPIIHIVGSPPDTAQKARKLMHHTLMDGDFDVFRKVYEPITAYTAVLTPENAALEIPNAIRIAKTSKKPVYLVVADDLVNKPIWPHKEQPMPSAVTNPATLQAAVDQMKLLLDRAQHAVILADVKTMRFHWEEYVRKLAETMNVPVVSTLFGKGSFDENHPLFIGMYGGAFGSPEVREKVETADVVIAVGLVWADTNTANFTAKLNPLQLIEIQPTQVKVASAEYLNVMAEDVLLALPKTGYRQQASVPQFTHPYDVIMGNPEEPLTAATYYPRFQRMLKEGDIIIPETGTFFYGMSQVKLPRNVTYIAEGGWQSIGYATPSSYGACIAAPTRRVLLFTGDGSLQLTAQEISSMLYYGCKPIIFILNNDGYTIEKYLNVKTENQTYNKVPNWSYTKLAEAFGGDAFTATVHTNQELDEAIIRAEAESGSRLCIIEMMAADPMDAPQYMHNMRKYMEQQEKQQS